MTSDSLCRALIKEFNPQHSLDVMHSPQHWNAEFFLNLFSTLSAQRPLATLLMPLFVAKGSPDTARQEVAPELLGRNLLDAVIALPEIFYPAEYAPAALVLLNHNKRDNTVLFINALEEELDSADAQQAQIRKIISAYKRVRHSQPKRSEYSSPVCYAALFETDGPGVIIDHYAYLASAAELKAHQYSVSPVDYCV